MGNRVSTASQLVLVELMTSETMYLALEQQRSDSGASQC